MPSFFIGADEPLEIGKRYEGLREMPSSLPDSQPFVVARECTRKEFLDWYKSQGGGDLGAVMVCLESTNFYEIFTD
jgi:hypothetical protein